MVCAGIISQSPVPALSADHRINPAGQQNQQLSAYELVMQDLNPQQENNVISPPPLKKEKTFNEGRGLTFAEIKYVNSVGLLGDVMIAHMLGDNFAAALEGEAGTNHQRVLATLGAEFAARHGVKVTGEYLRQLIEFQFASGKEEERIGQYGAGVSYYYKLSKGILDKIGVNVSYSKADDKDL